METQSLHTFFTALMAVGALLAGAGGVGLYCLSRAAGAGRDMHRDTGEAEFLSRLRALQNENDALQARLRDLELAKTEEPPAVESPLLEAADTRARPIPIPVKTAPPPLGAWAGGSLLEEMIESPGAPEAASVRGGMSDRQRRTITAILRRYTDRAIAIHSVDGDDAGFQLAWALKAAFAEAGWRVEGVEQVAYTNPPMGLFITSGNTCPLEEAVVPHEALATAGFAVSRCVDSNLKGDRTVLRVGVGSKSAAAGARTGPVAGAERRLRNASAGDSMNLHERCASRIVHGINKTMRHSECSTARTIGNFGMSSSVNSCSRKIE